MRAEEIAPPLTMLGPCRGSAVQLSNPTDVLMISEGIENVLSAMEATGYPVLQELIARHGFTVR
jgi:hypothetical protein